MLTVTPQHGSCSKHQQSLDRRPGESPACLLQPGLAQQRHQATHHSGGHGGTPQIHVVRQRAGQPPTPGRRSLGTGRRQVGARRAEIGLDPSVSARTGGADHGDPLRLPGDRIVPFHSVAEAPPLRIETGPASAKTHSLPWSFGSPDGQHILGRGRGVQGAALQQTVTVLVRATVASGEEDHRIRMLPEEEIAFVAVVRVLPLSRISPGIHMNRCPLQPGLHEQCSQIERPTAQVEAGGNPGTVFCFDLGVLLDGLKDQSRLGSDTPILTATAAAAAHCKPRYMGAMSRIEVGGTVIPPGLIGIFVPSRIDRPGEDGLDPSGEILVQAADPVAAPIEPRIGHGDHLALAGEGTGSDEFRGHANLTEQG